MKKIFKVTVPNIHRSRLFVASTVLNATGGGLIMAFMMIYFERTTTLSLSVIGFAIATGRALSSIAPLFIGRLLDSIGPRKLSIWGDFVSGVGFILCIFAKDPVTIMLTQFLTQAGSHVFWTSNRGLVSLASKGEGMQTWFGLIASIRNIGLGSGTVIASLAFSRNALEDLYFVIFSSASLYILSCIALFLWRPEEEVIESNQNCIKERYSVRKVISDGKYRGLLIINFGLVLAAMVIPLIIVIYATGQLGLPPLFSGALIILNTGMVAVMSTHVASWTKKSDAVKNIRNSYLLNVSSFILFWAASLVINHQAIVFFILIVAMIIYSIAEMLSTPSVNILSIHLAPKSNNGSYMAAFQMTWSVGMTLAPALFGLLMDFDKNASWYVLLLATIIIYIVGFRNIKGRTNGCYED
ncbi:MFS transporter [Erwinia sp. P6884]|uniref:MFS transporter n=1 Tax=Erwinia sp. P6884 TaxID=3141450 RepID=UPI0031945C7D